MYIFNLYISILSGIKYIEVTIYYLFCLDEENCLIYILLPSINKLYLDTTILL